MFIYFEGNKYLGKKLVKVEKTIWRNCPALYQVNYVPNHTAPSSSDTHASCQCLSRNGFASVGQLNKNVVFEVELFHGHQLWVLLAGPFLSHNRMEMWPSSSGVLPTMHWAHCLWVCMLFDSLFMGCSYLSCKEIFGKLPEEFYSLFLSWGHNLWCSQKLLQASKRFLNFPNL